MTSALPCPNSNYAAGERFGCDAFDRLLAGGINIEQAECVGVGKGGGEFIHQIASASEAVRLEDDMHAPKSALASRGQRRPNLRGMVSVIVDHADARRRAFELEAAIHTAKTVERRSDLVGRNVQRSAHCNCRCCVEHVVRTRNVQREFS